MRRSPSLFGSRRRGYVLLNFACGCLAAVGIVLVVLVIGGYFFFESIRKGFVTDPAVLRPMLEEVLPSVEVPPGYETAFGFQWSIGFSATMIAIVPEEFAVDSAEGQEPQGDPEEYTMFMVMSAIGMDSEELENQLRNEMSAGDSGETVESEIVDFEAGGNVFTVQRTVEQQDDARTVSYFLSPLPNVALFAAGPEEAFDLEAFRSLLASIDVPAIEGAVELDESSEMAEEPAEELAEEAEDLAEAVEADESSEAVEQTEPAESDEPAGAGSEISPPQP